MKAREFWLSSIGLGGSFQVIPPLDDFVPYIQRENEPERIKVREVVPIDWQHIWVRMDSMLWPQDNPNEMISREREMIQELVEKQLRDEE